METLIIRADANATIGHGHVMRCLALAQAWQDRGGRCIFVSAQLAPALETRLKSEHIEVVKQNTVPGSREDAINLVERAAQNNPAWVIIDGYHFAIEYQRAVKVAGLKLLVIDDYGQIGAYAADLILDQNAGAGEGFYHQRDADAELLLGTRYAMLRREFQMWRGEKREIPATARKILVTMGGSDPENLSARIVEGLHGSRLLETTVVVGGGSPQLNELQEIAAAARNVRVLVNVPNMPELMANSDMAVIAGGGTLWELLYMGCPVLSLGRNAQQRDILSVLHRQRIVEFLGLAQDLDPADLVSAVSKVASSWERRLEMSSLGRIAVDGFGANFVCEALGNGDNVSNQFEYRTDLAVRP